MRRVNCAPIRFRSLPLLVLASALCVHPLGEEVAARADDFGDLGTLQGTPSKPGRGGQKPARTPPKPGTRPSSTIRPSRAKPRSRPARTPSASNSHVQSINLTGTWQTTDGWIVHLRQTGAHVVGTYSGTGLTGTMDGNFNGKAFRGTFTYHEGPVALAGPVNLSYSPIDERLTGSWTAGLYSEGITAKRLSQ